MADSSSSTVLCPASERTYVTDRRTNLMWDISVVLSQPWLAEKASAEKAQRKIWDVWGGGEQTYICIEAKSENTVAPGQLLS